MGRRKKKKTTFSEALFSLVVIGILGSIYSKPLREIAIIIGCFLVIGTIIWIGLKIIKFTTHSKRDFKYRKDSLPPLPNESSVSLNASVTPPSTQPTISKQLRKIDWFQFEKLIELIYRNRGYSVQRFGGAKPDGGVDLIVESGLEKLVVQCKHWRKWRVGVRQIREFLGTLTDSKISKGIFITLTGYSRDAKQLADKHTIQVLDESDVIRMLEETGLIYSREISELLSDLRKFCPKCESELIIKTARRGFNQGGQFWGCSNYPNCNFIFKTKDFSNA